MGREVKRVPMDFDWPMNKTWTGFLMSPCNDDCEGCKKFAEIMGFEISDYGCPTLDFLAPPKGEGWQMWETCSEGSPISPVFKTPEDVATWLADTGASSFGSMTATYEQWLAMIHQGLSISMVIDKDGMRSGVEEAERKDHG